MAGNSIGTVNMRLVFNADEFVAGLTKADRALQKTLAQMEKETGRSSAQIRQVMIRGTGWGRFPTKGEMGAEGMAATRESYQKNGPLGMGQVGWDYGPNMNYRAYRESKMAEEYERGQMSLGKFHRALIAVEAAASGVNVAISLWKGNITEAQEKMKELPSIIGDSARIGQQLGESLADLLFNNIYTRLREEKKRVTADFEATAKAMTLAGARRKQIIEAERALALSKAYENQRPFLEMGYKEADELATAKTEQAKLLIVERYENERAKLAAKQKEERQKEWDEEIEQQARDGAELSRKWAEGQREISQLQGQIRIEQLRQNGQLRAAEIEAVRQHYDEQIQIAKEAKNWLKAANLETLRDLALRNVGMSGRAIQGIRAYAAIGGGASNPQVAIAKQQLEEQKKTNKILGKGITARAA